jgi:hypothetical protein
VSSGYVPVEHFQTSSYAIHPSAWNRNSANFAFTEFSEVRAPARKMLREIKKMSKRDAQTLKIHREFIGSSNNGLLRAHPCALREGQTRREAGAQSLVAS